MAALAAISGPQDEVTFMLNDTRKRRDHIHGWLTAHPAIQCVKPKEPSTCSRTFLRFCRPTVCGRRPTSLRRSPKRTRGRDGWRGLRCARLPPHLNNLAGAAARGRHADPSLRRITAAGQSRCVALTTGTTKSRGIRRVTFVRFVVQQDRGCNPCSCPDRHRRRGPCPHRRQVARALRSGRARHRSPARRRCRSGNCSGDCGNRATV